MCEPVRAMSACNHAKVRPRRRRSVPIGKLFSKCYLRSMTNTITVRLKRSKAEILAKARPNVNAWVNGLIDQALGPADSNWEEHYRWLAGRKPVRYRSDEIRKLNR